MVGAREYAELFETGQRGRLYLVSGEHAKGKTFHIQVLPEGEKAIPNGKNNLCLNKNAVEVYGVIGGRLGWTESYGWLHKGKWQEDFLHLTVVAKAKKISILLANTSKAEQKIHEEEQRIADLLQNYERT